MYSPEFLVLDNYFSSTCKRKDLLKAWLKIRTKFVGRVKVETSMTRENLVKRIRAFLAKYAGKTEEGEYTSPDAYCLESAANMLEIEREVIFPFSEWGSGGYKPYSSKEGRAEHDLLVAEISKICKG